jgi:predicted phosphodiesterase
MPEKTSILKKGKNPFKILLLSDTHFGAGFLSNRADKAAAAAVRTIAERAKSDLIVINGDMIYPIFAFSGTTNNKKQAVYVSNLMESLETPWTFVFGNHDQERHSRYKKDEIADVYLRGKNCLFQKGPENIDGVGNYIIEIANQNGSFNTALVFLDSQMYIKKGYLSGFDHVHDNQIEWYKEQITSLSRREGRLIPSLMFFHLPIKEFSDAWRTLYLGRVPQPTDTKNSQTAGNNTAYPTSNPFQTPQNNSISRFVNAFPSSQTDIAYPTSNTPKTPQNNFISHSESSSSLQNNAAYNSPKSPSLQNEVVYHCGFVNEKDNYFGYPKTRETHIFDDVLALGSTKGMFFGHDHLNTLSLTYKGIRLTYPMSIDYLAYVGIRKKNTQRGGTLIEIYDDASFEITHFPLNENCPMKRIKL